MPLYSLTSKKNLSNSTKQKLVDLFTDAHCVDDNGNQK